jgi:hypothetical protein
MVMLTVVKIDTSADVESLELNEGHDDKAEH